MTPISVSLKPYNNRIFYKNKIFSRSETSNYFYKAQEYFQNKKISLSTIDTTDPLLTDITICCDVPYPWELGRWTQILRAKRRILINFESPIINSFSQMNWVRHLFDVTLTWETNILSDSAHKVFRINIPYPFHKTAKKVIPYSQKKLLVAITANKNTISIFNMISKYKTSLYKVRKDIILELSTEFRHLFDLYGKGWDDKKLLSVNHGIIEDKLDTLRKYRFSLVVENASAPGYITEKILDCLTSGCVPIYLGAPDVSNYIPEECFINMRNFSSVSDLIRFISVLPQFEYKRYLASAKKFISSGQTRKSWSSEAFFDYLINLIKKMVHEKN